MSDSDDTDILLLIPPDYFITSAEEKLQQEESIRRQRKHLQRYLDATQKRYRQYVMDEDLVQDPGAKAPTTAVYQFLPPNKKAELNLINARLQSMESMPDRDNDHGHDFADRFAAPSDISTISACTVRSHYKTNSERLQCGLVHSTPKGRLSQEKPGHIDQIAGDGVLSEIDNFLEDRQYGSSNWNCQSEENVRRYVDLDEQQALSLNRFSMERSPHVQFDLNAAQPTEVASNRENNLISLSEIWSKSGQNTAIATGTSNAATSMSLKEEKLRRQHLEKTVHLLQTRLLEYQQRISVAIEVDKQKDSALKSAQNELKILQEESFKQRETLRRLDQEQREYNEQKDLLQRELAQAVSLATKFQEKNEKLEMELGESARKTSECNNLYKTQLEELEVKMHGCKRSEEFALNELNKLKDRLAKSEYQTEKLKVRSEELEKENSTLKHQKEMLQEFHQKLKVRVDGLENQRKSLQDSLAHLTDNELTLKKKLEAQQKTLKMHYQQQLENVVAQKLKEFQEQLDKTEETLKSEARDRERLIADRAVKQLELINDKNELEHNLLQEKHNEEVELYRIQLANASKKIDDLELKLNTYKSKRADIAEKLHDVMEVQWKKALEILTSPSNQLRSFDSNIGTDVEMSPDANEDDGHHQQNGNAHFETPKTSKSRKNNGKQNNLNIGGEPEPLANVQKCSENKDNVDRLQAYIELLLSKSPSDVDKLDEILALSRKARNSHGKFDRNSKRNVNNHGKPPWKA